MHNTLTKLMIAIAVLAAIVVPVSMWQRQRSQREIVRVSTQFVRAISSMDLLALRRSVTPEDRRVLPFRLASAAAEKLRELNKDVRVDVKLSVIGVKMGPGEASVRLKRVVTERGTRLGKPVDVTIDGECVVICVYDGSRWYVDLDRTASGKSFSIPDLTNLKACLSK